MWFGRTWRGRAGPKVISRAVTSETHFPTIKEREKLSGPNIARFHGIESNICVCVCVCVLYLPATITHRHTHTLLSHPKQWQSISKCVYLQRKTLATKKWEILRRTQINDEEQREEMIDDVVWWCGVEPVFLFTCAANVGTTERKHETSLSQLNGALSEIPPHHVLVCVCVCTLGGYARWVAPSGCSLDIKHNKAASGMELIAISKCNQTNSTH